MTPNTTSLYTHANTEPNLCEWGKAPESAVDEQVSVIGTTVSEPSPDSNPASPQPSVARRAALRDWRRTHGAFVARECGVHWVPQATLYDPKRAERTPSTNAPLTEADVNNFREELRQHARRATTEHRSTLDGLLGFLAIWGNLPEEHKAQLIAEHDAAAERKRNEEMRKMRVAAPRIAGGE